MPPKFSYGFKSTAPMFFFDPLLPTDSFELMLVYVLFRLLSDYATLGLNKSPVIIF